MFRVAAHSDIGPRKQSNQDSCCAMVAQTAYGDVALISVCDGVGGLSSGEVASSSVIRWLTRWFEEDLPRVISQCRGDFPSVLKRAQEDWDGNLSALNFALKSYGDKRGSSLGTTFTAILLGGGVALIGHIGDTRVYRFRAGDMEILTHDQTWVAQEVAKGNIPPEKARFHPKRNIILQSVGTQRTLNPVYSQCDYLLGDAFMVCCDGFRNELFDDELIEAFSGLQTASEQEIHDSCEELARLVLQRGERDNITAVALSCQMDGDYGAPIVQVPPAFISDGAGD